MSASRRIAKFRTFEYFDRIRPGYHSLHVLDGYSHLDIFYGKDAHRDVFPLVLDELDRTPLASRPDEVETGDPPIAH